MSYRNIRYVRLKFVLSIEDDTVMPKNKNSALRGGMGEMLLRANCIRDRDCDSCDFEGECIVRRTMYSKMEIQPEFMTSGDSVGYVISCVDYREQFFAGDTFIFYLTLFGKTIVYFNQYLNAFYALGREGVGKNHSRFQIINVCNSRGKPILNDMDVYMENYRVETLKDYIDYRRSKLCDIHLAGEYHGISMYFFSPLTVKYQGEYIQEFNINAILEALKRRMYILCCFEGIENDSLISKEFNIPVVTDSCQYDVKVKRHSNRKKSDIILKGIEGNLTIDKIDDLLIDLMLAGEITHIGKNTSFGFGGYKLRRRSWDERDYESRN